MSEERSATIMRGTAAGPSFTCKCKLVRSKQSTNAKTALNYLPKTVQDPIAKPDETDRPDGYLNNPFTVEGKSCAMETAGGGAWMVDPFT